MGVNSLPKTFTRQRRGCDLNPGPSAPESSTLTTRLPSHPSGAYGRDGDFWGWGKMSGGEECLVTSLNAWRQCRRCDCARRRSHSEVSQYGTFQRVD